MIKIKYEDETMDVELVLKDRDSTITLSDFLEEMIKPMLLCAGYAPSLVDQVAVCEEYE